MITDEPDVGESPSGQTTDAKVVRRWTVGRAAKWSAAVIFASLILAVFIAYWTSTNDCGRPIPAGAQIMKAIKVCEYGTPDVLQVADVEKPTPNDNQILVKIRAASLNPVDGHNIRSGLLGRLFGGLRKPKLTSFGIDYAGVVEVIDREYNGLSEAADALRYLEQGRARGKVIVRIE